MILGSLVAVGLSITACSSDDGGADETTPPSEAPVTTSAPTDPPATEAPAASTPPAPAGSGFDTTFGTDGILASPQSATDNDRSISVAQGADGLVYTGGFTSAGDDHMFAVSRYTADGQPDASFGEGGTAAVNVIEGGGGAEVARGLVVQDDGMVVVSGPFETDPTAEGDAAGDLDIAVIRLDATGTPDPTFGTDGIARIDLGAGKTIDDETYITDNVWGLTARDGGYALFAITPNQQADRTDTDYAIVGLTDTGALDDTFGTAGVVVADIDASGDNARNIGTSADGSILATGYSRDGDGVISPTLIKMSAQGVLDETFGTGGIAVHAVLQAGVAESYQWVPQGENYVLAGYGRGADSEEKVDLIVCRFLADGSWDESFGTDGVTRVDLAGEDDRARNLAILPDGNLLAVGSGKLDADNIDAMAVMLDADGALVESFGDGGHMLVDLGGPGDAFFGVDVAADDSSVYLVGFKGADPDGDDNDDAVLARIAL